MNSENASPPPIPTERYNQRLHGFYGQFGTGGGAQVVYLQSAIEPAQLKHLRLISDIPGSETWGVRDLFQREVDVRRVTNSILPYFKDQERVKFFNPLTLTVLPYHPDSREILDDPPNLASFVETLDGRSWTVLEAEDFYRYRYIKAAPYYACLEWNDKLVDIVAIDGQHRLSALKRYANDTDQPGGDDFSSWTIPVVVLAVRPLDGSTTKRTTLDVIRNLFVYINKEARPPSPARQILLNDESINAVCTQELLDYAHSNDVLPSEQRDLSKLPLLLFDWRGEEQDGKRIRSPASIITIEELNAWLEYYLLGEDFSDQQKNALGVKPSDSLHDAFISKSLPRESSEEAREIFRARMLPGIALALEKFEPFATYTRQVRECEGVWQEKSDTARHAFHRLRFGSTRATDEIQKDVVEVARNIEREIGEFQDQLPRLVRQDIGMRGIMSALGSLRKYYNQSKAVTAAFEDYAEWFTNSINAAYAEGWLDVSRNSTRELLLHIAYDTNDNVVNYRLNQADHALGALLACVVSSFGHRLSDTPMESVLMKAQEEYLEMLSNTLLKGHRKDVRARLKTKYPTQSDEYKERLANESEERAAEHLASIEDALEAIRRS